MDEMDPNTADLHKAAATMIQQIQSTLGHFDISTTMELYVDETA